MSDIAKVLKCRACVFFEADAKAPTTGRCHRKSPEPDGNKPAIWPQVSGDGWCGEWRKKSRQSQ